MKQRPPGSTRTDPLVPETTLFRSVESRYADRTQVDSLYGLADSLSHGALVYGAGRRDNLAIDQLAQTATLYFNSAKIAEAKGANPAGDVLRLLVWLANHVASRHAGGLRAGQTITTGSCTGMRSEERREGKECASTCRSRWS